jgi:hypothetical protein
MLKGKEMSKKIWKNDKWEEILRKMVIKVKPDKTVTWHYVTYVTL